jgi:hypothetical protein
MTVNFVGRKNTFTHCRNFKDSDVCITPTRLQRTLLCLQVAPREITDRQARFFSLGRRINEVASVSSFMKHSKLKQRCVQLPLG